jgi:RNA polymerase sigma-70 factor (ECF subfamily)
MSESAQHIRTVTKPRLHAGALPLLSHVQTGTPSSDLLQAPQATFESLFSSVAQGAYGIAMRLTRNKADAEDLLQDAALSAHRGFDSFTPGSNFRAWFFKILINCYYSKRRKEKSRPVTSDLDDTPDLYLYARSGQAGFPTQGPDPAAQLLDKLGTERIIGAINRLPEDYRVVSTLYFMEDLSYEEIARALECPVGTVRSRLHRGRKMLQKALWEIAEEDGIVRHDEQPEDE